jgi:type-F conjugative transfer system pilin assembly thiol-disulfide isomerase TrbB
LYAGSADISLHALSKQQGFFFFYSSSCPHCQRFAPTLKRISQQYGFSVVAISVDGGFLSSFPDAVMDEGQTKIFQVSVFPSLFLVNPKDQLASLVTEGDIDEGELINRLLKISQTHDKEVAL